MNPAGINARNASTGSTKATRQYRRKRRDRINTLFSYHPYKSALHCVQWGQMRRGAAPPSVNHQIGATIAVVFKSFHNFSYATRAGQERSPLPATLDGTFDVVFDANGSLSPREGERLIRHGGKVIDIVPTRQKFLKALVSRSRKVVISNMKAENLQPVVDLAAARKLAIPIAQTISLADAPALLSSLEQGERLNGKVVIAF